MDPLFCSCKYYLPVLQYKYQLWLHLQFLSRLR
eukprot:COSAG03_NODE_13674_length_493_cov_1.088832_1_plen_32_part_01